MKKAVFMLRKLARDLQQLPDHVQPYTISPSFPKDPYQYPFVFDEVKLRKGVGQGLISAFDTNGIPLISSYIDVDDDGDLHYYPITIGQVGLSVYQTWHQSGSDADLVRFRAFVDWFLNNVQQDSTGSFWMTAVPKPEYRVREPWKSAFTQSRALSILLRGKRHWPDLVEDQLINDALSMFERPYYQQGVSVLTDDGGMIYEEYVADAPTMVLDGHLFSLFGLSETVRSPVLDAPTRQRAQTLFEAGIVGLKQRFADYDMGFWLRFNLCAQDHYPDVDPCTIGYMKLIALQLDALHQLTGDDKIRDMALKTSSYLTLPNALRALKIKRQALQQLNRL